MRLKKRERILAIVTAVLVVLFLGKYLWSTFSGPNRPQAQHDELTREIQRKKRQIDRGRQAETSLAQWRQHSLPSDLETARSLYQNWLLASAETAGFQATKVEASPGRQQGNTYRTLRFRLQADTTLDNLTRFLHSFYSTGYLHHIQNLNLLPREDGKKIGLQLSIEALALSGLSPTNHLPKKPDTPLLASNASQYAQAIGGRNVFAPYHKPEPPPAEPPLAPQFDPVKHVYLTAIVTVANRPQAWIVNRTSGDSFKLYQGEEFRIGDRRGKVQRIGQRDAEVEFDGQRYHLSLGKALEGSVKLP